MTHTTREAWLHAFTDGARLHFELAGATIPDTVRVSIGFPSSGRRGKAIGECWHGAASTDGAREIFIKPSLQSSVIEIAGVLTHELIHAAFPDGEGHGKLFGRAARALGLEGKLTATTTGEQWAAWAQPIIDELGPFPGAKLDDGCVVGGKKKQVNRQLLVKCSDEDCDFKCRTSAKHVPALVGIVCPACCSGELEEG